MVFGAVACSYFVMRLSKKRPWFGPVGTLSLAGLTLINLINFNAIYATDSSTSWRLTVPVIVLSVALILQTLRRHRPALSCAFGGIALIGILTYGFERRSHSVPEWYFEDSLAEHGASKSIPRLIISAEANTIVTDGTATGMVALLRPDLRVINLPDRTEVCAFISKLNAIAILHHRSEAVSSDCVTSLTASDDIVISQKHGDGKNDPSP
jgi:hypothetical protein